MSTAAVSWAYDLPISKSSHKCVLVALAWKLDENTGQCNPKVETISFMTGLNRKTVMVALDWLREACLIEFNPACRSSRNYTLNTTEQSPKTGTIKKQGCSASFGTKENGQSPKNGSPKNGHSKSQKRTNEVPKQGHNKQYKQRKLKYNAEQMAMAEWIWGHVQRVTESDKKPNLEAWANQVRLLNENDSRELRLIGEVFKWANQDSFWSANILSPQKLRQKFDQLLPKYRSAANGNQSGQRQGSNRSADIRAATFGDNW